MSYKTNDYKASALFVLVKQVYGFDHISTLTSLHEAQIQMHSRSFDLLHPQWNRWCTLHWISSTLTKERQNSILQRHAPPSGLHNMQQNNDPRNTSNSTRSTCTLKCKVEDFAPQSPEQNKLSLTIWELWTPLFPLSKESWTEIFEK